MLLAEVVETSGRVAATTSRSAKIAGMARLLARLAPDEVEAVVAALAGEPRQGKVGVGWATLTAVTAAPASVPSITVAELDHAVSLLQAATGEGSALRRERLLAALLTRATADEAFFIRRLLIGDLRQGALQAVVADAVARAASVAPDVVRRAAMLSGNLARVAVIALTEGEDGLAAVGLEVLRPVQPMLAATAATVSDALAVNGLSSVEWKLDGARVQAHRRGEEVRLFTRNLNDVTARLPGVAASVRSLPGDRFILDGEVIGLGDDERPELFQDTMRRFGRSNGTGADLAVWWFDCLHLDGADLLDHPLSVRRQSLELLAPWFCVPAITTADAAAAQSFLDRATAAGHEGVMVKAVTSTYQAGRRGRSWKKVKPVRTLDLVVLAAEWGHGRRHGWLSNLHLGARQAGRGFVMVGKTFKGLTDELLAWQTGQFLERETTRRGIVVAVRPELVVEIALDGVQSSTRYPGGVALRFARVRRYRPDKTAEQSDLIDDVRAMLPARR